MELDTRPQDGADTTSLPGTAHWIRAAVFLPLAQKKSHDDNDVKYTSASWGL